MSFISATPTTAPDVWRFADHFTLHVRQRELRMDGVRVDLGARAYDLLFVLVQNPGQELSKARLLSLAWPNLTVDENNLHVQISTLRKVLGPDMIATIPGRGYQFKVEVRDNASHDLPAGSKSGLAHDLLLQARATYRIAPSERSFTTALAMLERAVLIDPDYVDAWIEIATVNNFAAGYLRHRSGAESFAASRNAVQRAVALQPNAPKCKIWSANIRYFEGDLLTAFGLANDALSRAPSDAGIVFSVGHYNALFGYTQDALPFIQKATEIDPFDGFAWTTRALICENLGDREGVEAFATRAAGLGEVAAFEVLAWSAYQNGDAELASERYSHYRQSAAAPNISPDKVARWEMIAKALFAGCQAKADALRERLKTQFAAPDFRPDASSISMAAKLGLAEAVFSQWRDVFAAKSSLAVALWSDLPWARALRAHPAFPAFLRREGFIDLWRVYGWPDSFQEAWLEEDRVCTSP
jgi:DNA-binding winged helix-turn-helix (wHTH) protein